MIKITLPTSETLPNSQFFTKITQASTRGDFLVYNDDYTQATLELSTDAFFTIEDAKNIVNAGGEVEGYPIWVEIDKNKFENDSIPLDLFNDIYKDSSEDFKSIPTWESTFKFVKPNKENELSDDSSSKIKFLTSFNSELLNASIVVNDILNKLN